MIKNIIIPLLAVIVLTYGYFFFTCIRKKRWWWQLLYVLVAAFVVWQSIRAATWRDYFPDSVNEMMWVVTMLVVCVAAPAVVALCQVVGAGLKRRRRGTIVGWSLVVVGLAVYAYGILVGSKKLEIRYETFYSADLPEAFDGYRIVHVSDLHVGSYIGSRVKLLQEAIDSINAQDADIVAITGDLQNKQPDEIEPHLSLLSTIKGKDGVFSVLGNHDYAEYIDKTDAFRVSANLGLIRSYEKDMGWTLLNNGHVRIDRDSASIYIAGMENDGEGRFPQLGDIQHTLFGLNPQDHDFVVMLEHDPSAWHRKILPHSHTQLTLSGHTHGGQIALFGWYPASIGFRECCGMYYQGERAMHVTKGLGAVVPFRFGASPEIVVITLHRKK